MPPAYDRWYLVPPTTFDVTDENGDVIRTYRGPKYSDMVTAFSGNTVPKSIIEQHYNNLAQRFPSVDPWFIVRFYDDSQDTLDTIDSEQDSEQLPKLDKDVTPIMDDLFPDDTRSPSEWEVSFSVG